MWKAIIVSAALLAAILLLTRLQGGVAGLDPKDQLAFEKQTAERRRAVLTDTAATPADLACAATRVSELSVRTLYLVWVNQRSDLTTEKQRDDAMADLGRSIIGCGGNVAADDEAAHRRGLDLGQAASEAMLQAGR